MLHIRNLRSNIGSIHHDIFDQVTLALQSGEPIAIQSTADDVSKLKANVEAVCGKLHATPADLGTPSFRSYLWLRYIAQNNHLYQHMQAVESFTRILMGSKHAGSINWKVFHIKIDYSGYLYHRKSAGGRTTLQTNAAFSSAPLEIKKAIIAAAFAKRRGNSLSIVRDYAASDAFVQQNKTISGHPIANKISCAGEKYDLAALFNRTNQHYFSGGLPQPRLVWSSSRAKRRLGYYHPEIHTIAVNQKLDSNKVPRLVVEYVLYHEMLHQHFGIEHRNGRRYAHTTAFHAAEKRFEHAEEAENLIKLLQ